NHHSGRHRRLRLAGRALPCLDPLLDRALRRLSPRALPARPRRRRQRGRALCRAAPGVAGPFPRPGARHPRPARLPDRPAAAVRRAAPSHRAHFLLPPRLALLGARAGSLPARRPRPGTRGAGGADHGFSTVKESSRMLLRIYHETEYRYTTPASDSYVEA